MRDITEDQFLALRERHGQEFYYMVHVDWPGQTEIYARRSEEGLPFPVKPYLLEINDYYAQGRLDGFGTSESITVKLADPFGQFKALMDYNDLVDVTAQVALRVRGRDRSAYIVISTGYVSLPITWSEGDRTFSFVITNSPANNRLCYTPTITDVDVSTQVGYIPMIEAFDFGNKVYTQYYADAYISSEQYKIEQVLNTKTWPLSFNYVQNVAVSPVAKSPVATVTRDVPDTTGGWAQRQLFHEHNVGAKRYNYINQDKIFAAQQPESTITFDAAKFVDITEATGKVIIPISGSENFPAFTDLLFEIESGADKIICIGKIVPEVTGEDLDYDPYAINGYLQIDTGPSAVARLLPRIANPNYNPNIPEDEQNPQLIPDITQEPIDWEQTEAYPALVNFNLPIYSNIKVFQRAESLTIDPYADTDDMTVTEKKQDIIQSYRTSSRTHFTDKARQFVAFSLDQEEEQEPDEDYEDLTNLKDTWNGFGQDGYSEFFIHGTYNPAQPSQLTSVNVDDPPWLAKTIIEVEVPLGVAVQELDPSAVATPADVNKEYQEYLKALIVLGKSATWREFISRAATKAYMYLEVTEQRGLWCKVYNPLNFRFNKIVNVYRVPSMYKEKESLTSLFPTVFATASPTRRQIQIKSGAKVSLFNWQPAKQYVVDSKPGTTVLGVKYRDTITGDLAGLPRSLWGYSDMEQGTLWAGYHPPCTMLYVSYNGMIRLQASADDNEVYVDLDSPYRTDEDIIAKAVELTHPYSPRSFGIRSVQISTAKTLQFIRNMSLPRFNTVALTQETGIKDFVSNLAFQNGKLIQSRGNTIFTRNFMKPVSPGTVIPKITANSIIEKSLVMGVTSEVKTLFNIVFHSQDATNDPIETTRKNNMDYYGEFGIDWDVSAYSDFTGSFDVLNFWIAYFSNYWRTLTIKTTMEFMNLEPYDLVELNFDEVQLNFQTPYTEVLGSEAVQAAPFNSFANTYALVTSIKLNIEEGTIDLELWLPIIAGQTNSQPLEWDTL